jgi:hypothetical protein
MLSETLRSRWFSACVHAGLWLLLLLVVTGIGGKRPYFREARPDPAAVTAPVPVAKLENLFAAANRSKPIGDAASLNPFITSYFIPQTAPQPPAPTTRKIELTYLGFYQTGNSPKRAMIRIGDALVAIPVGGSVATNLSVANATVLTLTLTNSAVAGQSNVLALNTKKEIEIPIR